MSQLDIILCTVIVILILLNCIAKNKYNKISQNLNNSQEILWEINRVQEQLKSSLEVKILELEKLKQGVVEKDKLYEQLNAQTVQSKNYIASLMADFLTLQYEISARYLETKKHPAIKEAKRIKELRGETKEIIARFSILKYKYDYLFHLFPDLDLYSENLESLSDLVKLNDSEYKESEVDTAQQYLSKEEYNNLSENERNQLALERYITSSKNKWQIGRDYELFVGYEYSKQGWDIEYFGIDKQLEDMGRDIIAENNDNILIVQCKYWSQQKLIHEKHIAQLYGTTIQYILEVDPNKKVIPVFVTNIKLSDKAKIFARYLNVQVRENVDLKEFPRIKCNINTDEFGLASKIYHLPMDQQYDRIKICKKGEFFAFTVEEAVKKGFRRAWKWYS